MKNYVLKNDIDAFIEENRELIKKIDNSSILITGATGLIGSFIVYALCEYNLKLNGKIKAIALVRNQAKAEKMFEGYPVEIKTQDITSEIVMSEKVDYIIHGASVTASKDFVQYPLETIKVSLKGTENVLKLAERNNIKGLVYLSSLEIYGTYETQEEKIVKEDDYGILNPINIRNCYPESKRISECIFASAAKERGIHAKIARLTQTFGSGVEYNDNRVFAEFARCAIEGKDIILHTKGETVRNYCYISDAVSAILYILLYGEDGTAYNVSNDNTAISIYGMAELAAEISDFGISVVVKNDVKAEMGYNPVIKVKLDSGKLKDLGWKPKYNLREMFMKTIQYMSEDHRLSLNN